MKTIKTFLIILFAYLSSYAQDPQLFENDWYLQKVIIFDEIFLPPSDDVVEFVPLLVSETNLETTVCNSIGGTIINLTNDFIELNGIIYLEDDCFFDEEYQNFEGAYFSSFFMGGNYTYFYQIESNSNNKTLTLTNSLDYEAIYSNELLSNQDFVNLSFNIYPNPVLDVLYIQEQNFITIRNIKIYDVLGRLVLEEKGNINQLDVSSLAKGLLFIKIETNKGNSTKKIIKQ